MKESGGVAAEVTHWMDLDGIGLNRTGLDLSISVGPQVNTHNCKCFLYARRHGFRGLLSKRMMRNTQTSFIDVMSKPMVELLEGLLAFDPSERLTLGESGWPEGRRSVWDLVWVDFGPSVW